MSIDITEAILALGGVFWLAGGAKWLAQIIRKLKLENDLKEKELEREFDKR